jgi:hypothetical protein
MSSLRDTLRSAIFSGDNSKPASETVEFFGQDIEIRQPAVGTVLADAEKMSQQGIIGVLIQYCYVPGTDEKLFDEADADSMKALPWGPDFLRAQQAINKLSGVKADDVDAAKND